MTELVRRRIVWRRGPDPAGDAFVTEVDGARLAVRVGDFPAEPLYTLLVDGVLVASLDAWPAAWTRPT